MGILEIPTEQTSCNLSSSQESLGESKKGSENAGRLDSGDLNTACGVCVCLQGIMSKVSRQARSAF